MNSIISIRARKYLNRFFHRPKVSSTKKHVEQCTKGKTKLHFKSPTAKRRRVFVRRSWRRSNLEEQGMPAFANSQHYTTAVLLSVLCSSLPLCRGTSTNDDHAVSARGTPSLPTSQAISPILMQFQPQSAVLRTCFVVPSAWPANVQMHKLVDAVNKCNTQKQYLTLIRDY